MILPCGTVLNIVGYLVASLAFLLVASSNSPVVSRIMFHQRKMSIPKSLGPVSMSWQRGIKVSDAIKSF
jgi:hypothetical protein